MDSVLSEQNTLWWDCTEDAEETGAAGKFTTFSCLCENVDEMECKLSHRHRREVFNRSRWESGGRLSGSPGVPLGPGYS